jgi:quercetin 2,3-dioxygenase
MKLQANKESKAKSVKFTYMVKEKHWVGDGFHVHGLLRPSHGINKYISPFILMDYASPKHFSPSNKPKGVGQHPHRGFETVTFSYQGEVEHRDSSGGGGIITSGDVQWMTAGKGVVHDEFHSEEFSQKGGVFEMVQLWVNLPKKYKMTDPKYQGLSSQDIPKIQLGNTSELRVIAGDFGGTKGPATTFTKINIFDLSSNEGDRLSISLDKGTNTILLILRGEITLNHKQYEDQSILIFDQEGEEINFETSKKFRGLLLNGEPIEEPMVAHGPFVMNTKQEINEAIQDYQNGKMGNL